MSSAPIRKSLLAFFLIASVLVPPVAEAQQPTKKKLLIVSEQPTWEFRLVQRLFQRDESLHAQSYLGSLSEERKKTEVSATDLPNSIEEFQRYDLVVMIDPKPETVSAARVAMLKQYCTDGGGLLFVAGPAYSHTLLENSAGESSIFSILPVKATDSIEEEGNITQAGQISLADHGKTHALVQLNADSDENEALWASMPAAYWTLSSVKAKAEANTLLEFKSGAPLLVVGRVGEGNVAFLGNNATWRWRRAGRQGEYFDKFWKQVVEQVSRPNE